MKIFTPLKKQLTLTAAIGALVLNAQELPESIVMKNLPGGTFTMGSAVIAGNAEQQGAATEHEVTLSPFSLSEAEITNAQYVEFLNSAYTDGLIEIVVGGMGPDEGKRLIQGTAISSYNAKVLYSMDGTRVMKDHDDADLDEKEWTGDIEPENPINTSYIDFNETTNQFYVKNPHDLNDFNWFEMCNYQDYGTVEKQLTGPILNDFDDWAGAGNNYSDELEGWTEENPAGATKLPSQAEVAEWPVTFIKWWGAQAFVEYYGLTLPTDAQWEFAAKGGSDFKYAVHDGEDLTDPNWNPAGLGTVAYHHVRSAISGTANPYGMYNMAGNAWEWIYDNYQQDLGTSTVTDPIVLDGSTSRVWRGGSWNYHEATLQSAFRHKDEERMGNDHFGFRIAGPEIEGVGIQEKDFNFDIYPNPTSTVLNIQNETLESSTVLIYNLIGRLMYTEEISGSTSINIEDWTTGIYIIEVNGTQQKLIKK